MKVCLYFISVFFSSCCIADVFHYRMPFRIQTYSPVTKSKIENFAIKDGAQKLLQINREKLLMLLNRSSNECYHFDDKNVRIYIIDGKDRYYIDKNGVVSYGVPDNVICSNNKINEDSIEKILLEGNIDFWKKLKIK